MGIEARFPSHRQANQPKLTKNTPTYRERRSWTNRRRLGGGHHLYIPMCEGHAYLVVIMDWHSRAVLS